MRSTLCSLVISFSLCSPLLTAPATWRVGVPESVSVHTVQQSEGFPITVSLVSFPDKKTTFSSALLSLTPKNGFRGAVELVMALENSPAEFVYLVAESEVFREEWRIAVSGGARTKREKPDCKRRRGRSLLNRHEVQTMISRYQRPSIQRCCLNGSDYYTMRMNCNKTALQEALRVDTARCRQVAEQCCVYTEDHMYKILPMAQMGTLETSLEQTREEPITISVTQISAGRTFTATFTVKTDPTQDVSIHVSSRTMAVSVGVWFGRAPPEEDR
ncbi:uncharacterized protein LOC130315427 [Hyla sarda]|uniref:uncharacterized protein LOC130315427 n=1 Tax=Hyla sarda TaxID=327740 RepID=UPI0024C38654|nr:uncharacterized protein LOC130315427 [Hyla sarda]